MRFAQQRLLATQLLYNFIQLLDKVGINRRPIIDEQVFNQACYLGLEYLFAASTACCARDP